MDKKICIISQAIFPADQPRAFRATELAKELARKGYDVVLYAVLGVFDYSSFEKEFNIKVKNIGKMWFATLNSDNNERRNFIDKVLGKLLHRLIEYPNIEFMFRMPGILRKEKNIYLLISSAHPHPIHWGCAAARSFFQKKFPQIWIADCGDPYMGNKFFKKKPLFYFRYLEEWFCAKADYITIPIEGAKDGYYPKFHDKVKIIPQGFQFNDIDINTCPPNNQVPTFAYAGVFYKGFRDPSIFLQYLTTIKRPFKFIIYTQNQSIIKPYLSLLYGRIEVRQYIPRNELLKILSNMDFLINIENGTLVHSPSKLIDYAIAKRPILSFSPDVVPRTAFEEFLNGNYAQQFVVKDVDQYRIESIAERFISLMKNMETPSEDYF